MRGNIAAFGPEPRPNAAARIAEARRLVLAWGWNSTAYQILNPGIQHWFNEDGAAVVGYVRRGRFLLAAGEPVCAASILRRTIRDFERFAEAHRCRVCYVCAEERMRSALEPIPTHSIVTMGAQPVWDPAVWPQIVRRRPSVRAQLHRAVNKQVVVGEIDSRAAARDPELRRVLFEWLEGRKLPPMHFMVEPDVLRGTVEDRVVLTARRHGALVAYLVASPVTLRNGYLIEELARTRDAPNGTIELLIDAAMARFAREGRGYVTMGLVALADGSFSTNPLWLRMLMHFARAHANRFYNFRGLESFRKKMEPAAWEKIYLIANRQTFSPGALYAVGGAFSGISPVYAIWLGVVKAMASEFENLAGVMRFRSRGVRD